MQQGFKNNSKNIWKIQKHVLSLTYKQKQSKMKTLTQFKITAENVLNFLNAGKTYIVDADNGSMYECDKVEYFSWHHPEYHDAERSSWLSIEMKNEVRGWGLKKVQISGLKKQPLPFTRSDMSRHIFSSTTVQENCPVFMFRNFSKFI